MRRKAVLFLLSGGMVATLVLAACSAPAKTSTPATTTTTTPVTTTAPSTTTAPTQSPTTAAAAKPQYGGTLTTAQTTDVSIFDPAATGEFTSAGGNNGLVNEQFLTPDWTQGPAGTGKVDFAMSDLDINTFGPGLASSWSATNPTTFVLNIRQGVHWALNPNSPASVLVDGSEMTADDVVNCFNYLVHTKGSALQISEPTLTDNATIEKTGPWQVTIKTPGFPMDGWTWLVQGGGFFFVLPTQVVQKYGSMSDWHNVVGTGPYMLTNLVPSSEVTFERNPNYWGTNPLGPGKGDKLPYIDTINELIIPDLSTEEAALRTAKLDLMDAVPTDDAKTMMQTTPDLKNHRYFDTYQYVVSMRTDKTNLPFSNVKVRQALMMATDFTGLSNLLYGGDALVYNFPAMQGAFPTQFVPMDQLPQSVQALYQYNPDQAKQLLTEAGYPNGFNTTMVVQDTPADVDAASAYKSMWAKVGINVTLQPEETGVWTAAVFSRNYDQMMLRNSLDAWSLNLMFTRFRGPNFEDGSYVDDPPGSNATVEAAYQQVQSNLFVNFANADAAFRNLTPYVLGQAYYIPRPDPASYNFWWPWVENYYGSPAVDSGFLQYHWINSSLKKQMGH